MSMAKHGFACGAKERERDTLENRRDRAAYGTNESASKPEAFDFL